MMKLEKWWICLSLGFVLSCGSERVIMANGAVYDVKGTTIMQDGKDVTASLSEEETAEIKSTLKSYKADEEAVKKRLKEIKTREKELKKVEAQALAKREALEAEQEAIEHKAKEQEKAREAFLKAKKRFQNKKERFEKLKEKGKLSPKKTTKWEAKLEALSEDVKSTKEKLNNLNQ
ncbi:MAG: hypothetical protein ABJQ39_11970 [Winogradskyella arenosi]